MNTKLLAGLAIFVLLMGVGSFALGHTADAQTSTGKKAMNKVEKQRENRDKTLGGHQHWVKAHSSVK